MSKVSYIYGPRGSGRSLELLKLRDNCDKNAYIVTYSEISAKELRERAERFGLCSKNIIRISELGKYLPTILEDSTLYIDDLNVCFLQLLRWFVKKSVGYDPITIPNLCCAITQSPSDIYLGDSINTTETIETEITDEYELKLEAPPTIHISGGTININFPTE